MENWPQYKEKLVSLVIECFPQHNFKPQVVEQIFTKTYLGNNDAIALLKDEALSQLIGFSAAHIFTQSPDTANIAMTGIASEKRGQKLVGILMEKVEEELKKRGVVYIIRDSRINDGYADSVEKHYQDRIIEKRDGDGNDPKRYFKIKL